MFMQKSLLLIIVLGFTLSGCVRDIDLARDVNLLIPSPSPGLDTLMNQVATPQTPLPTVVPTLQPTPIPAATPDVKGAMDSPGPATVSGKQVDPLVSLSTSKGIIQLQLYSADAPLTVKNFLDKGASGYYANLIFHRVESWVVQGGDPKGNGTGGGSMPTELNQRPFKVGSLGVARGGDIKVSNDSQFFICTEDCSWLTGQYTNFGDVVSGMDVVKQIAIGDKILSISAVK
jgi:cyclophilin family peptidyl-prolyl cis-trans isomerase